MDSVFVHIHFMVPDSGSLLRCEQSICQAAVSHVFISYYTRILGMLWKRLVFK